MVIIMGGLDISVGSVYALAGIVVAKFHTMVGLKYAILLGLLVGVIFGLINGLSVTKLKINPLITTIATMSIARGLAFVVNSGSTAAILDPIFGKLGRGMIFGLSNQIWYYILAFIIFYIIMKKTIYGKSIYAIGSNERSALFAGIKVDKIKLMTYVLSAIIAALVGIIQTSQMGAGAPQAGIGLEMSVIAAVILGGTSLDGGKGTIIGTTLGVLLIGSLNNGLLLKSVSSDWQNIITGGIMLLAIAGDQLRKEID